jgi:hypothetical protein
VKKPTNGRGSVPRKDLCEQLCVLFKPKSAHSCASRLLFLYARQGSARFLPWPSFTRFEHIERLEIGCQLSNLLLTSSKTRSCTASPRLLEDFQNLLRHVETP